MHKLEITLTEEQYQHIQEEIKYYNRSHLSEGVFGGYELCLRVPVPLAMVMIGSVLGRQRPPPKKGNFLLRREK